MPGGKARKCVVFCRRRYDMRKAPDLGPKSLKLWCPGADLNHRHADFQSAALPTELPGRFAAFGGPPPHLQSAGRGPEEGPWLIGNRPAPCRDRPSQAGGLPCQLRRHQRGPCCPKRLRGSTGSPGGRRNVRRASGRDRRRRSASSRTGGTSSETGLPQIGQPLLFLRAGRAGAPGAARVRARASRAGLTRSRPRLSTAIAE